jgi:16S rRNA processing protein RimM
LPSSGPPEFVVVGRVGRPHGLDGSFVVEDASTEQERFATGAELWAVGEPGRIVASRRARGRPVIRLDREVPRGTELQVPVAALPSLGANAYYVFELVGLQVEEVGGRRLGRVASIAPGFANDVLELDSGLALPMVEQCISEVDLAAGRIVVARGFAAD